MSQLTRSVLPVQSKSRVQMFYFSSLIFLGLGALFFFYGDARYNAGYEDGMALERSISDGLTSSVENNLTACRQDIARLNRATQIYLPPVEPVRAKPVFGPRNAYPCAVPRSKRLRKDLRNWGYCYTDGYRKVR